MELGSSNEEPSLAQIAAILGMIEDLDDPELMAIGELLIGGDEDSAEQDQAAEDFIFRILENATHLLEE